MNALDALAWQAARAACMFQRYILSLFGSMMKNASLKDKVNFISGYMSMEYIINTPPEQMPDYVRKQMLMQGRFLLGVLAIVIARMIFKMVV